MSRSIYVARIVTGLLFLILGIIVRINTADLPFGSLKRIQSGFFPTVFGNLMIFLSVVMLISLVAQYRRGAAYEKEEEDIKQSLIGFGKFFVIILGFIVINYFAGFNVATFIALLASGYVLDLKGWRLALLAAVTTFIIWIVFDIWLMLSLPTGIWFS